jgi:outer membrane protein OmpA-like peptidoglycan-associated protein
MAAAPLFLDAGRESARRSGDLPDTQGKYAASSKGEKKFLGRTEMNAKWSLLLAGIALVSLPAGAQEKNSGAVEDKQERAASADLASRWDFGSAPRNVFGVPDAPRVTPFPAAASGSSEPPGRLVPRFEVGVGYSYVLFDPGSPFDSFNNHGANGSFTYNASRYLGLTVEVSGYELSRNVNGNVKGSWSNLLFGPRLNLRRDYFVPFVEFLAGATHGGWQINGNQNQNTFALAAGAGVDIVFNKWVAWRFAQIDYLMTNYSGPSVGGNARQDNFRIGSGLVVRFGFPQPPSPPKPKVPPTASCSATPPSVFAESNDAVALHVTGNSPDSLPLTYSYTATGGAVEGTGPDARWNSSGVSIGSYTVTAKVDDGKGGTASCTADIRVEERPHRPPTISCSAHPTSVKVGEHSTITCNGNSPDNLPLTYSYSTSGGQVTGNGTQAQFDSSGAQPGTYSVKGEVTDSRGDKADSSADVQVTQPAPPPEQIRLEQRLSLHSVYFPTALPSVAKPNGGLTPSQMDTLNALAVDFKSYLTYKPDAHLTLEGHADIRGSKEYNDKLSERRVERVRSYLVEKGVAADHIEVRAYGFEKNMSSEDVKNLIESDSDLTAAEKQRILRNLLTVRLANNRRVDVVLSTTGEQSVRKFPFNAKDALTLLSRSGGGTGAKKAPGTTPKKPAPKKTTP